MFSSEWLFSFCKSFYSLLEIQERKELKAA